MRINLNDIIITTLVTLLCSASAMAAGWKASADLRERYQSFDNFNFNSSVDANGWEFDSRLYVRVAGDFGHGLSAYLQPQAVAITNHSKAGGTQQFSQADLLQAYLQYHIANVSIRLGRQQLVYGDQRLLGHLGWKDVARTFDGVKGMYHAGSVKLDVFAVHPADIGKMTPSVAAPQGQSLVTWEDRRLIGAYGTYIAAPDSGIDAYLINWHHNQHASVGQGRNLNTFGMRLFGKWSGFDGTAETVFQTGTWSGNVSQKASAYAVKAGYTFDLWQIRIGVEYDYSPGDDKADATTHKNFVFPFHTNHMHYGEMDRFSWGNMKDLRFSMKTTPLKGLTFIGNAHLFYLAEATGDWLNVVGTGIIFAGKPGYTQTKAGTEIDLKLVYNIEAINGLKLVGLYGIFNPGGAVTERNAGNADVAKFGYLIANYKF